MNRTRDPNVDHYAPGHLAALVKALSVSLAVLLLLAPVFVLFLVPLSREAMAWLVFGFVLVFAITVSILTEAETQGLLIGTATFVIHSFPSQSAVMLIRDRYAAIIATFLGNMNQGTSSKNE